MLDTNGDQGGERLRSTVERQPTASAVFRHCEATRKQITAAAGLVVEIGTPSRDLNASSSGDGECEVSSVLRPKRKSYCDELARLFEAHAARLLPPAVAARGLRIERVGHGLQRHVSQVRRRQSFTDLGGSLLKLSGSL